MTDAFNTLAQEFHDISIQYGYDPENKDFVIYYMIQMLKRGDMHLARIACMNDADKITNDDLRTWIVENLYQGEEDHPWRLLWLLRKSSKEDPDF